MFEAKQFKRDGTAIQVGGLSGGLTGTTALPVSGIIEVQDVGGAGAWIAFGASNIGVPSADSDNSYYIPPNGITRPFIMSESYTHVRGSAKINVRSLDVA